MQNQKGETNPMVITGIVILIVALIGGFFILQRRSQPTPSATVEVTETPTETPVVSPTVEPTTGADAKEDETTTVTPIKVTMNADVKSNSKQKGTATLTETNGKVRVVLSLSGYESAAAQPSHIHAGTCAAPGKIVFPLNDVVDGKSDTTLNTTIADLKKQLPLIVNVHKSADELTVYTSCGDLK